MPNPDELLSLVQRTEQQKGRGHLKIFLGMVAGVGKTFAMLQRAQQLKQDGVDVVIGWIETHGRRETANLLEGLSVFPRRQTDHKGVVLEEMDLEGLLKKHPKVVIVDELAHTNAPGGKHAKRHQDVLELLNAGIDVYTTVNIQHLESRVDTVKAITGVAVHETVPDAFFDAANEIVLIDLPPEDLLIRLKEGRIYPPERIDLASKNFFKQGNLTALRELALRTAAGRVDRELREFKTLHGIDVAWKSSSRLMVAVFASPYSEPLIRWTRQLAETTGGSWIGVYVDTNASLTEEEKRLLEKNTELVRKLGGDFASIQDQDLVDGLLRVARQSHVTQIIVGKSQRGTFRNLFSGGSVVNRLLRKSGDIDVYVVATEKAGRVEKTKLKQGPKPAMFPWGESGGVLAVVSAFWAVATLVRPVIGYQAVAILFLMAVLLSGVFLSRVAVFSVAVFLSLIHNYFFIPPIHAFSIRDPEDVLMHLMFFLAATSIGHLTTRLRRQNRIIESREDRAIQLFNLAHAISEARSVSEVGEVGVKALQRTFNGDVAIVLYQSEGKAIVHPSSSFFPGEKEMGVAEWARQNGTSAGRFTETLPSAEGFYMPMRSRNVVLGVVGIRLPKESRMDFDRKNLAQALVEQLAAGIEREKLHESSQRLEILEEAERLYRSLFDSVSHELKTPLTTIKGAISALPSGDLVEQISTESERLLRVVDNMLDMTRLESGSLKPKLTTIDLADILGPALKRIEGIKGSRTFQIDVAPDIKPIVCDSPLVVQALANIFHNSISHLPDRGKVVISALNVGKGVEIRIRDDGPGLPKENPGVVFERFYRQRPERSGGVGLGLSIAKGFLEAQGGTLTASNHEGGGAVFTLRLPASEK